MKLLFKAASLLSLISLFPISVQATSITANGAITTNTTWNVDTVFVTNNIHVWNGIKLTITQGTYIEMQGFYRFQIDGSLQALGAPNDSIIFTVPDTVGLYTNINSNGGWRGIFFQNVAGVNDSSILDYCIIQYTKRELNQSNPLSAIEISFVDKVRVSNCSIKHNHYPYPSWAGGILCLGSSAVIINNYFYKNYGDAGGAIGILNNGSPLIHNNIMYKNYAERSGGGIMSGGSNPIITNNVICNNQTKASNCGPADGGAGIRMHSSMGYVGNNLIANNHTGMKGGGIECLYGANPDIENNTIVNNNGYFGGGGLYVFQSNPTLRNNILWGNTRFNSVIPNEVFLFTDDSDPNIYNCCIAGDTTNFLYGASVVYTGIFQNNINTNPVFISPSGGAGLAYDGLSADWKLQGSSTSINAGTLSSLNINLPSIDLWGNPRISGPTIDIGAYEALSTTINNSTTKSSEVTIYPNPTNDFFGINYTKPYDRLELTIYNAFGQFILQKSFNDSERIFIDISNLDAGIYFVSIINDKTSNVVSLVVD